MVLKEPWLSHVLDGRKTMEIRKRNAACGFAWVGSGGLVYGSVTITKTAVMSVEEFRAAEHLHLWPAQKPLPYDQEFQRGLLLANAVRLPEPVPFTALRGAIGWCLFRRDKRDLPARSSTSTATRAKKKRSVEDVEKPERAGDARARA